MGLFREVLNTHVIGFSLAEVSDKTLIHFFVCGLERLFKTEGAVDLPLQDFAEVVREMRNRIYSGQNSSTAIKSYVSQFSRDCSFAGSGSNTTPDSSIATT